jgi:tight adherence protein C
MGLLGILGIAAVTIAGGALVLLVFLALPSARPAAERSGAVPPLGRARSLAQGIAGSAPRGYIAWLEKQIVLSGHVGQWSVGGILIVNLITFVVGLVILVAGISASRVLGPFAITVVGLCVAVFILLAAGPVVIVNSRASDRQKMMLRALPDTLDQMTIAVEAGLGFDAAMLKAATNGVGPLAEELVHTLQDMSIGRSRRDAYRALEARTNIDDLRRFIRAIVQADQYGIAIADVLRVQASEIRVKRRQRAEADAMKVPIKIVFPLVFCILPVLFIVLLTPAVLSIVDAFS